MRINRHFTSAPTSDWCMLKVALFLVLTSSMAVAGSVASRSWQPSSASSATTSSRTSSSALSSNAQAHASSSSTHHSSTATASVQSSAYIVIPPSRGIRYGVPQSTPLLIFDTSEAEERHVDQNHVSNSGEERKENIRRQFASTSASSSKSERNTAESRGSYSSSSSSSNSTNLQRYFPRRRAGISPYGRKVSREIVTKSQQQKSLDDEEKLYAEKHTAGYAFQWNVANDEAHHDEEAKSGSDLFSHKEGRNGSNTTGEYRVQLPDGRLQVVSYDADENGYRAKVSYLEEDNKSSSSSSTGSRASYNSSSSSSSAAHSSSSLLGDSATSAAGHDSTLSTRRATPTSANSVVNRRRYLSTAGNRSSGAAGQYSSNSGQQQVKTSSVKRGQMRLPASFGVRGYYAKDGDSNSAINSSQQQQQVSQQTTEQKQTSTVVRQRTRGYVGNTRQKQSSSTSSLHQQQRQKQQASVLSSAPSHQQQEISNGSNIIDLGYAKVVVNTQASILLNHNHQQGHHGHGWQTVVPVQLSSVQQRAPEEGVIIAPKGQKAHMYGQQSHHRQESTAVQQQANSHHQQNQQHQATHLTHQQQTFQQENTHNNQISSFFNPQPTQTYNGYHKDSSAPAKSSQLPPKRFSKTLPSYDTYGTAKQDPANGGHVESSSEETNSKIQLQDEPNNRQTYFSQENNLQAKAYDQQSSLTRARGGSRNFYFRPNANSGQIFQQTHKVDIVKRDETEGQSNEQQQGTANNAYGHQESHLSYFEAGRSGNNQQQDSSNFANSQQSNDQTVTAQISLTPANQGRDRSYNRQPLAVVSLPPAHKVSPQRLAEFARDSGVYDVGFGARAQSQEDTTARRTSHYGAGANGQQVGHSGSRYVAPSNRPQPNRFRVSQYSGTHQPDYPALYRGSVYSAGAKPYQGHTLSSMATAAKYSTGRYGHGYRGSWCPTCPRVALKGRRPSVSARYSPRIVSGGSFQRIVGGRPVIYYKSIDAGQYGTVQSSSNGNYGKVASARANDGRYGIRSQHQPIYSAPRRVVSTASVNYTPYNAASDRPQGSVKAKAHATVNTNSNNGDNYHSQLQGLAARSRAEAIGNGYASVSAQASASANTNHYNSVVASANAEIRDGDDW